MWDLGDIRIYPFWNHMLTGPDKSEFLGGFNIDFLSI